MPTFDMSDASHNLLNALCNSASGNFCFFYENYPFKYFKATGRVSREVSE